MVWILDYRLHLRDSYGPALLIHHIGVACRGYSENLTVEPISKRPLLPNICVPAGRDLSTGSNFNPRNTQCITVVNPDDIGTPSLILNPAVSGKHFETASV